MPRASTWLVTPDKFLTPAQVSQLREYMGRLSRDGRAAHERYAIRNGAIIETLLGTGLRVSELCALVVGDLFLEDGAANVLVRRGKGGKAGLVPVSDRLAGYLREYLKRKVDLGEGVAACDPVFVSERRGHLCRSAVHRIWKGALKEAGLDTRWGVHATRHSYAVEIYRKTRDLRLTQRLLRHSSPGITQVYANLLDDDVRRGVAMVWA
jgi:integrase/recombinase XerD